MSYTTCKRCDGRGELAGYLELVAMREDAGLSQGTMARGMKVSAAYISAAESGNRPVSARLTAYYEALAPTG